MAKLHKGFTPEEDDLEFFGFKREFSKENLLAFQRFCNLVRFDFRFFEGIEKPTDEELLPVLNFASSFNTFDDKKINKLIQLTAELDLVYFAGCLGELFMGEYKRIKSLGETLLIKRSLTSYLEMLRQANRTCGYIPQAKELDLATIGSIREALNDPKTSFCYIYYQPEDHICLIFFLFTKFESVFLDYFSKKLLDKTLLKKMLDSSPKARPELRFDEETEERMDRFLKIASGLDLELKSFFPFFYSREGSFLSFLRFSLDKKQAPEIKKFFFRLIEKTLALRDVSYDRRLLLLISFVSLCIAALNKRQARYNHRMKKMDKSYKSIDEFREEFIEELIKTFL